MKTYGKRRGGKIRMYFIKVYKRETLSFLICSRQILESRPDAVFEASI